MLFSEFKGNIEMAFNALVERIEALEQRVDALARSVVKESVGGVSKTAKKKKNMETE